MTNMIKWNTMYVYSVWAASVDTKSAEYSAYLILSSKKLWWWQTKNEKLEVEQYVPCT